MRRRNKTYAEGFTLLELLIVIAIIAILVAMLFPTGVGARREALSLKCKTQLREIVTACKSYAGSNKGRWPNAFTPESTRTDVLPDEPGGGDGLRGPDIDDGRKGTDNEGDVVNSSTASLWLLVAGGYVPAEIFICPCTADETDLIRNPDEVRDFLSRKHCSYSYQCLLGGRRVRESWSLVVLADRSPFFDPYNETDDPEAGSFNHWSEGQNVAFADGRVVSMSRPYYDATGDWIYLARLEKDNDDPGDVPDGETVPLSGEDSLLK